MPAYGTLTLPPALYPGDSYLVWVLADSPTAGAFSERIALGTSAGDVQGLSVEVVFGGAPGAFEVDVQTSDTDTPNNFISEATTITVVNANNVARVELINVVANFVRLSLKTLTNAVTVVAKITAK